MENEKDLFIIFLGRTGAIPKFTLDFTKEILLNKKINNFKLLISKNNLLKNDIKNIKKDTLQIKTPIKSIDTLLGLPNFIFNFIKILKISRKENNKNFFFPMTHVWNPLAIILIKIFIKKSNIFFIVHDGNIHPGDLKFQYYIMQLEIFLSNYLITLTENVKKIVEKRHRKKHILVLEHPAYDFGVVKNPRILSPVPTLLFFGRIVEYKGLSLLLKSFLIVESRLQKENKKIQLLIAGSGEIKKEDLKIIEENQNSIELINRYIDENEISGFWDRSDICTLTYTEASQSGIIAIAVNKAMPCIITPIEGLKEQTLINNKEKTFATMSNSLSPEEIADSIIKLLDKNLYEKLSQNAINHQKELGWDKWIEEISKLIK